MDINFKTRANVGENIKYHSIVKNENGEIESDKYEFGVVEEVVIEVQLNNIISEYCILKNDISVVYDEENKEFTYFGYLGDNSDEQ